MSILKEMRLLDIIATRDKRIAELEAENKNLYGWLNPLRDQYVKYQEERQKYRDKENMEEALLGEIRGLKAEIDKLRKIKEEAERIQSEAHLKADHFTYDLMKTILAKGE